MKRKERKGFWKILNGRVFWIPAILVLAVLVWGCAAPQHFAATANQGLEFVLKYFNWFQQIWKNTAGR